MEKNNVTIIIPAKNEEKTIVNVIEVIKKNEKISQIIVVNNNSNDHTAEYAKKAGAQVVDCEKQGKGYAMKTGMQYVKNEIVVFIDADINGYSRNSIDLLINPLLNNETDFVKSTFERTSGGLVTMSQK